MLPASISISGGCRHFGRFDFARHPGIKKRYPGSSAFVHPGVTRRKIMALQRLLTWMRLFVGDHDCRGIREAPVEVQMASTPCEVWSLISVGPEFAPGPRCAQTHAIRCPSQQRMDDHHRRHCPQGHDPIGYISVSRYELPHLVQFKLSRDGLILLVIPESRSDIRDPVPSCITDSRLRGNDKDRG
jgi:hypothetical protein